MSKDPNGTVKRITDALELAATEVEQKYRFQGIYEQLMPLTQADFPEMNDGNLFVDILDSAQSLSTGKKNPQMASRCLKRLWELYWRMSSNQQYQ
ncbi:MULTISPECIES: hypothetical protein [Pseudomonas]|uniref:Uncharacterized protein n=1 Tax=Pseudomonas mosselii TaxID=78327 RepID=A0ABX9B6L7_9PSED|nr:MULTISPECIES: hypothetical protein [Pseudomonas]MCL8301984.1 hypothetical protein [Pseudomonas mosselii]MCL8342841.1 hypothetical protein [Pseudomonas mosselii]MCU9530934.1 hypothetical protein [Pseudomonas mosselii]MCU9535977.1 hypothetical protein [Pseudomonas mosselii]MCU9541084.1 hypothetical protein [Pseudomonas mosselii]